MMMDKAALIIIFNHRYDRNLPLLREMYKNRFANIRFLMPFYDGEDDDVIPIYESSYYFQGFFIQAYRELIKLECDAFLFISDDQIINPMINEGNTLEWLHMNEKDIYIDSYADLNSEGMFEWFAVSGVAKAFLTRGIEYKSQLPSYNEAVKLYEKFCGKKFEADYSDAFWGEACEFCDELVDRFVDQNEGRKIPYPLLFGYADYFCVRKEKYYQLARICGIFAAMNLFVEIAFPTAVMLTFDRKKVVTRQDIGKYSVRTRADDLSEKYNNSLAELFQNWDDNLLFIHPIKLSRWNEREDNEKRVINELYSKLIKLPLGKCEKIGIYGTGENTENMMACYQEFVGEIKAEIYFIDSYIKSGSQKYMEREVHNVNDLETLELDEIIVSSMLYEEEMVRKLNDIYGGKYKIHRLYNGNTFINFVNYAEMMKNSIRLPQLKVKFIGIFDHFSGRTSLIYRLLSKYYSLVISDQPELLVYSHAPFNEINGDKFHKHTNLQAKWLDEYCEREHEKYRDCVKVLWKRGIKENGVDDFDYDTVNSSFDYVVGYPYLNNDKYFYFNTDIAKQCYDKREKLDEEIPIQFCSYVYMNENWGEGAKLRKEFYKRLSKYKKVDCLWNYEGGQNKYKFTIVFENHSKPGYASKIIWKAILSGSIPIYWGAPDICENIGLNPNIFVNCTKYGDDIDSMIAEIIRIDENDELYRDMRRQVPFKEKYSTEKLEEFLCNVAEEAKRGKNG